MITTPRSPAVPAPRPTPDSVPLASPRRRGSGAPVLWAVLASAALAALYARACLLNLTTGVVGGGTDGYENLWNNWWVKTALLDLHQSPFYTHDIYYPTGVSLFYHTLNPANGLLTLPFNALLGYVPTINLLFVASLAATCFAAWLLLRDLTGRAAAAFAGAALFTFGNPLVLGFLGAGQAQKLAAEWLPFYFFALLRALQGRPIWAPDGTVPASYDARRWPGYAALAVGLLLVTSLTDWQYLLYEVLATLLYFGCLLLTRRPWRAKGIAFARLAGIGGLYAAIVMPTLLVPMVQEALANPWLAVGYQSALHSLDVANLLGPGPSNPGYLALALAVVGFGTARGATREAARFWAFITVVCYLIALGPYLLVGGHTTTFPLPYLLIQDLPVFNIGRDPGRFASLAMLGLAVLVTFGLGAILDFGFWILDCRLTIAGFRGSGMRSGPIQNPKSKIQNPKSAIAAVLVGGFLLLSLGGPVLAAGNVTAPPPDWPAFYEQISQDPNDYAIVELPLFTEKGRREHFYQMYQVLHHKPRLGGHWSRDHALTNPHNFVKTSSLFRQLWVLGLPNLRQEAFPAHDFLQRTDYATQGRAILSYYNVRYIVLYKEALDADWDAAGFQRIIQQVLGAGVQPYVDDPQMRVYRVPAGGPPANPLTLDVGEGWFVSEVRADGKVFRWADSGSGQAAQFYSMNLTPQPLAATLQFTAFAYRQPRTVTVAVNGVPATTLHLNPAEGEKPLAVALTLPPGNNLLTLSTPEPAQPTGNPHDARLLSFALYGVALAPR